MWIPWLLRRAIVSTHPMDTSLGCGQGPLFKCIHFTSSRTPDSNGSINSPLHRSVPPFYRLYVLNITSILEPLCPCQCPESTGRQALTKMSSLYYCHGTQLLSALHYGHWSDLLPVALSAPPGGTIHVPGGGGGKVGQRHIYQLGCILKRIAWQDRCYRSEIANDCGTAVAQ